MGHPNTGPWHALLDLALNTRHNHHHMSALESICVLLRTLRCHGVIVCCKIYGDSKEKLSFTHPEEKEWIQSSPLPTTISPSATKYLPHDFGIMSIQTAQLVIVLAPFSPVLKEANFPPVLGINCCQSIKDAFRRSSFTIIVDTFTKYTEPPPLGPWFIAFSILRNFGPLSN